MEVPQTPGEEKSESTEKKSLGRVRNAAEVLQQWLNFRANQEKLNQPGEEDIETDDDDDEEEEEGTVKKWRGVFKKFFGKQVSKEVQPVQAEDDTRPATPEQPRLPLFMTEDSAEDPLAALQQEQETAQPQEAGALPAAEQTAVPAFESSPTQTVVESTTNTPVEVPIDPLIAAHYEQPELQPTETSPPAGEVVLPLRAASQESPIYSRPTPEVTSRQVGDVYDDEIARRDEVNLNRSNILNTYRNHRRKKDIKETNREVKELKKDQQEATKVLKQQIEALATEIQAKADQPQVQPEAAPVTAAVSGSVEQVPQPPRIEKLPTEKVIPQEIKVKPTETKAPESLKEILQKRPTPEAKPATPLVQQQAEKLASHSYETVNPNVILEQVEKAAEADVAIEKLFEHRHEAKDSDAAYKTRSPSTAGAGGSTARGASAQPIHAVNGQIPAQGGPIGTNARLKTNSKPQNSEEAYKQAAIGGFWAAIMLLVFIGILLIIR